MASIIPVTHMQQHPFEFYKDKLGDIQCFLDKTIQNLEDMHNKLTGNIADIKGRIKMYSTQLGLPIPDIPSVHNLNLYQELLENELKRIAIVRSRAESEIKAILQETNHIKSWLGIPTNDNPVDEVSLERINLLRMQLADLKAKKDEKERQRQYFYDEIEKISSELHEKIKFTFDEKICVLEDLLSQLKTKKENREQEINKLKCEIENKEDLLKVARRIFDCTLSQGNIDNMKQYNEHLRAEQRKFFDQIFENTKKEMEEVNAIFGMPVVEYEKNEASLEIMRQKINELLPKKDMFCDIRNLINRRKMLLEKMMEFEKIASDPKRLFKSSFQLNSEEKFRNTAYPSLLKIEESLFELLNLYESAFGVFIYEGKEYKSQLRQEVDNRIINRTIFISRCDSPYRKKK